MSSRYGYSNKLWVLLRHLTECEVVVAGARDLRAESWPSQLYYLHNKYMSWMICGRAISRF